MESQPASNRYLKLLIIILVVVIIIAAGGYFWFKPFSGTTKVISSPSPLAFASSSASPRATASPVCSPWAMTADDTALLASATTKTNATYHFTYKMLPEWKASLTDNDQMGSYAFWPWGDESLAAINMMVIVGAEKVAEFPVGALVEESHQTVSIDCINATYTVYQPTRNDHWDKDEYHIRTTFTKDGVPYLMVLNYPFQGASADGDTVDAYNAILKSINFE